MQGRIQVLETKTTETATQEVFGETANREDARSIFATTEEEDHSVVQEEVEQRTHHKRARSLSPHAEQKLPSKEEEIDEDPSYRQFLASIRGLLELSTPEEYKEVPSKIFGLKDRKKKLSVYVFTSSGGN